MLLPEVAHFGKSSLARSSFRAVSHAPDSSPVATFGLRSIDYRYLSRFRIQKWLRIVKPVQGIERVVASLPFQAREMFIIKSRGAMSFGFLGDATRPSVSYRLNIDTYRDLRSERPRDSARALLNLALQEVDEYRARGCFLVLSSERNVYNKITVGF